MGHNPSASVSPTPTAPARESMIQGWAVANDNHHPDTSPRWAWIEWLLIAVAVLAALGWAVGTAWLLLVGA